MTRHTIAAVPLFLLGVLTALLAVVARLAEGAYQLSRSAFLRLADWIEP